MRADSGSNPCGVAAKLSDDRKRLTSHLIQMYNLSAKPGKSRFARDVTRDEASSRLASPRVLPSLVYVELSAKKLHFNVLKETFCMNKRIRSPTPYRVH